MSDQPATIELLRKAEQFHWTAYAPTEDGDYIGTVMGFDEAAQTVTIFRDTIVNIGSRTFPINAVTIDVEDEPVKPTPWDADKIALARRALEHYKTDPDPRKSAYNHLRSKWSNENHYPYPANTPCQINYGEHLGLSLRPAVIMDGYSFGGYYVHFQDDNGQMRSQHGVPRWALIIDGEQNWQDVTG